MVDMNFKIICYDFYFWFRILVFIIIIIFYVKYELDRIMGRENKV